MKTLMILLLIAFVSCEEPSIEPVCRFGGDAREDLQRYLDEYGIKGGRLCYVFNDTLQDTTYLFIFEYVKDSLAHCQPDQTITLCE